MADMTITAMELIIVMVVSGMASRLVSMKYCGNVPK